MLHDHEPECVSPIPRIIFDDTVSVHFDPEVEKDERPAKDPAEDVHRDRMVGREMEVGPGEARVCHKVAEHGDEWGHIGDVGGLT